MISRSGCGGWDVPRRSRRRIEKIVSEEVLQEKKKKKGNSREDSSIFIYIPAVLVTVCLSRRLIHSQCVCHYVPCHLGCGLRWGVGCLVLQWAIPPHPPPPHLIVAVRLLRPHTFASLLPFSSELINKKAGPPFPFLYPIRIVITPTPLCLPSAKGRGGVGGGLSACLPAWRRRARASRPSG